MQNYIHYTNYYVEPSNEIPKFAVQWVISTQQALCYIITTGAWNFSYFLREQENLFCGFISQIHVETVQKIYVF